MHTEISGQGQTQVGFPECVYRDHLELTGMKCKQDSLAWSSSVS